MRNQSHYRKRIFIIIVLSLVLWLASFNVATAAANIETANIETANIEIGEVSITTNPFDQQQPDVYGDIVVWEDNRNGNSDIYMVNLSSGIESPVTTNTAVQRNPAVHGNYIVYQDHRNGNWDIYMFNLSSGIESPVTTNTANQENPAVYGNYIVYQDDRLGKWDLYMFNLSSGSELQVTSDEAHQRLPIIHGTQVAWWDERNSVPGIYVHDLSTGNEVLVATGTSSYVDIYENYIVYMRPSPGGLRRSICLYDLSSNSEEVLISSLEQIGNPVIHGTRIVWMEYLGVVLGWRLKLYDLLTGTEHQLTNATEGFYPAIHGDHVVYTCYKNNNYDIYMVDFTSGPWIRLTTPNAYCGSVAIHADISVWFEQKWDVSTSYPSGRWIKSIHMHDFLTGTQSRLTTDSADPSHPDVYGDIVVWQDYRNLDWDVYMFNLSSWTEHRITSTIYPQMYPDVYDKHIVYRDGNNITIYDLLTEEEKQIANIGAKPAIFGGTVVWANYTAGKYQIVKYDLFSGTKSIVTTLPAYPTELDIYEDIIVWCDSRNGNQDIFMFDLSTGNEHQVTSDPAIQENPSVYGNYIVYEDRRNGNHDIYLYDISSQIEHQMTINVAHQFDPVIYEDKILCGDRRNHIPNQFPSVSDIIFRTLQIAPCNLPPEITSINGPLDPVPLGITYEMTGTFTDLSDADMHTFTWDWGDGTTLSGTVDPLDDTVTGSHVYVDPGVYTVNLTVVDSSGESDTATWSQFSVIYDPSAGFVTGGGWIDSPEGAYSPNPELSGKANFGFIAKYKKGATVPTGNTEFQFHAGDLNFHSDTYDWLLIAGAHAKFKGIGTINGEGSYKFMLTAVDGALPCGGGADKFRLKIWEEDEETGEESIIYDNLLEDELGGGSIKIHK